MVMKVALIGLDAVVPTIAKKLIDDNKLPTLKYLIDNGVYAEGLPVFPTVTSTNWTTIATGAMPEKHGITDMVVHIPGTELTDIKSGFYSNLCRAEHIWETCERFNKKPLLLKYIASWPPNLINGLQVDGFGAPGGPGSRPWGSSPLAISNASCYSTDYIEKGTKVKFEDAKSNEWKGITFDNAFETYIDLGNKKIKSRYYILYIPNSNDIVITKDKDASRALRLSKGTTSEWIIDNELKGAFRMKLMELAWNNTPKFKLYVTQIFPLEGWTYPKELARELIDNIGPFLESISHFPFVFGWIDENTYLDDVRYQAEWFVKASNYLMKEYEWDLFMMQWHGIDNTQHAFLRFDKNILTEKEAELADNVTTRTYQIADDMVNGIIRGIDKDTSVFVLSDHGHIIGKRRFFINTYLYRKGFIQLKRDLQNRRVSIDWSKTVVYAPGMVHLYINLKGREPHGIVAKGKEYEDLQEEIIDALYEIKDPVTNTRPIAMAFKNEDAKVIGLSGDRSGDIIYVANPGFAIDNRIKLKGDLFEDLKVGLKGGSIHGQQLGSVDLKEYGTIKSLFVAYGSNIKKGYKMDREIRFIDIAPTISYILDMPAPKDSEGRILYELFE